MADHSLMLDQDDDGWDVAECSCGWRIPEGVPGADIAAEFWHDHVVADDEAIQLMRAALAHQDGASRVSDGTDGEGGDP